MWFRHIRNLFLCSSLYKFLINLLHPKIIRIRIQFPIRKSPSSTFSKLHIRIFFQIPSLKKVINIFFSLVNTFPLLNNYWLQPSFCQNQSSKNSRRPSSNHNRTFFYLNIFQNFYFINLLFYLSNIFNTFIFFLINQFHIHRIHINHIILISRINRLSCNFKTQNFTLQNFIQFTDNRF